MDVGVSFKGLSALADNDGTEALTKHLLSGDKLPGRDLLQCSQAEGEESKP